MLPRVKLSVAHERHAVHRRRRYNRFFVNHRKRAARGDEIRNGHMRIFPSVPEILSDFLITAEKGKDCINLCLFLLNVIS